ncbi:putative protein YihR [Streptomyces violarus]
MQDSRTGRQLTLRHGTHRAVVVELGAALRSYTFGQRTVLDGFSEQDSITGGRGQVLVPWPNPDPATAGTPGTGRTNSCRSPSRRAATPSTGCSGGSPGQVVEASDSSAVLEVPLWPQPGYPFHLRVRAEYALGDGGLEVAVSARNLDVSPAPYGFGQHPYVTWVAVVDEAVLTVPARTWLTRRARPAGGRRAGRRDRVRPAHSTNRRRAPAGHSLQRPRPDADGRAVVRLAHPLGASGTDVWLGEGAGYVQLYTGDTLPPGERRRVIAVEPMTCPPDAFRSGTGLISLAPGERHTVRWGITPWGE